MLMVSFVRFFVRRFEGGDLFAGANNIAGFSS
jgi:hypothetical protein